MSRNLRGLRLSCWSHCYLPEGGADIQPKPDSVAGHIDIT